MKKKIIIPILISILLIASCAEIRTVADSISNPSAREVYQREFKDQKEIFSQWEDSYRFALNDSLEISLPYGEKGKFIPDTKTAYSYTMTLEKGKILDVEVQKDSINQRVFIDLFIWKDGVFIHKESNARETSYLKFIPEDSGIYKLVVQPEINADTNFFIAINENPLYDFPVAGKGNAAIQSFWGNERDGGQRKHEGIDIFAPKGTPVVAASEGKISRTGNHGIGGKQVWLRTGLFGNSLYYAHLDSIAVAEGDNVKIGDTLGFVGNTGNAKFTPPHLHFGIYQGYGGAVNPMPFVFKTEKINASKYPRNYGSSVVTVKTSKAILRKGPATSFQKIGELQASDNVFLLGENKDWLHISTISGQKAFLHKSLVKEVK